MKKIILLLLLAAGSAQAQMLHPVKWSYAAKKTGKNEAVLLLKADIEPGWHIYSAYQPDGGPVKTSFTFSGCTLLGKIVEPQPIVQLEEAFGMQVRYFEHAVVFQQKVRPAAKAISGQLNFMVCNNQKCLPPENINFTIPIK